MFIDPPGPVPPRPEGAVRADFGTESRVPGATAFFCV